MNNVHADYKAGKDWQRTAVTETVGFGLGTAAGVIAGAAVTKAALGIALLSTPVGWVFVIGAGIAAGYCALPGEDICHHQP